VPSFKSAKGYTRCLTATFVLLAASTSVMAQREVDPLTRARQAYNDGQFDRALVLANEAMRTPAWADSASVVVARALLDRYRRTTDEVDLAAARKALLAVTPSRLKAGEAAELHLGMAELMYFDLQFGVATELFEAALDRPGMVPAKSRDRVLEWWAASLNREAQLAPDAQRMSKYWRMLTRLGHESANGPATPAVVYWMAAAARGVDDLDRAWTLAIAAWIQAPLVAGARAAEMRRDVDDLMAAIIIERATRTAESDPEAMKVAFTAEWEAIKERWKVVK
jgi:hypothetical protein